MAEQEGMPTIAVTSPSSTSSSLQGTADRLAPSPGGSMQSMASSSAASSFTTATPMTLQVPPPMRGPAESPLPSPASETGPFLTFAEFRKMDENPRKFRHFMSLLSKQEGKLKKEGRIKSLTKDALRGKRERESSKFRSKDLFEQMDQQFNLSLQTGQLSTSVPTSSSSSSSLATNPVSTTTSSAAVEPTPPAVGLSRRHSIASESQSTPKSLTKSLKPFKTPKQQDERKKTRGVLFHLLRLAIYDRNAPLAASIINDLSTKAFARKKPFEANMCFLLAMANRMESTAIHIMAKGFPLDVNAPIFSSGKGMSKVANASYPSYFLSAVALGLDTLVHFMIKRRANLNQTWFGLTPLLVAVVNAGPHAERMLRLLIEQGANPAQDILFEQYYYLIRLKLLFPLSTTPPRHRQAYPLQAIVPGYPTITNTGVSMYAQFPAIPPLVGAGANDIVVKDESLASPDVLGTSPLATFRPLPVGSPERNKEGSPSGDAPKTTSGFVAPTAPAAASMSNPAFLFPSRRAVRERLLANLDEMISVQSASGKSLVTPAGANASPTPPSPGATTTTPSAFSPVLSTAHRSPVSALSNIFSSSPSAKAETPSSTSTPASPTRMTLLNPFSSSSSPSAPPAASTATTGKPSLDFAAILAHLPIASSSATISSKKNHRSSLTWSGPSTDASKSRGLDALGLENGWWSAVQENIQKKKMFAIDLAAASDFFPSERLNKSAYRQQGRRTVPHSTFCLLSNPSLEVMLPLIIANAPLSMKDIVGCNALHLSARVGYLQNVAVLLHFDSLHTGGRSRLRVLADKTVHDRIDKESDEAIRSFAVQENPKAFINTRGFHGFTPLHEACSTGSWEVVRYLLRHGADPSIENDFGDTPLQLAQRCAAMHHPNVAADTTREQLMGLMVPSQESRIPMEERHATLLLEGTTAFHTGEIAALFNRHSAARESASKSGTKKERSISAQTAMMEKAGLSQSSVASSLFTMGGALSQLGASPRLRPITSMFGAASSSATSPSFANAQAGFRGGTVSDTEWDQANRASRAQTSDTDDSASSKLRRPNWMRRSSAENMIKGIKSKVSRKASRSPRVHTSDLSIPESSESSATSSPDRQTAFYEERSGHRRHRSSMSDDASFSSDPQRFGPEESEEEESDGQSGLRTPAEDKRSSDGASVTSSTKRAGGLRGFLSSLWPFSALSGNEEKRASKKRSSKSLSSSASSLSSKKDSVTSSQSSLVSQPQSTSTGLVTGSLPSLSSPVDVAKPRAAHSVDEMHHRQKGGEKATRSIPIQHPFPSDAQRTTSNRHLQTQPSFDDEAGRPSGDMEGTEADIEDMGNENESEVDHEDDDDDDQS